MSSHSTGVVSCIFTALQVQLVVSGEFVSYRLSVLVPDVSGVVRQSAGAATHQCYCLSI